MDPHGTKFQPRGEGGPSGPGGCRAVGGHVGEAAGEQAHYEVVDSLLGKHCSQSRLFTTVFSAFVHVQHSP